jgi:hypothetical protein
LRREQYLHLRLGQGYRFKFLRLRLSLTITTTARLPGDTLGFSRDQPGVREGPYRPFERAVDRLALNGLVCGREKTRETFVDVNPL